LVHLRAGRPWGDTTIRGHAKKGTGLINNELYTGRRIWNRSKWIKNPDTGRRVQRLNAPSEWKTNEVAHLRIVDEELWQAVKRRQAEIANPRTDRYTTNPLNDRHRPRFLLSGLLTCGICGGGYTIRAKDRYGCATRGRQGTCSNARTISRQELERRVLDGLRGSLLTPELVAEFISEYQREWNRLQSERGRETAKRTRRLADVKRRIAGLVDAIEIALELHGELAAIVAMTQGKKNKCGTPPSDACRARRFQNGNGITALKTPSTWSLQTPSVLISVRVTIKPS
jgi:site-specific DNA recombinase